MDGLLACKYLIIDCRTTFVITIDIVPVINDALWLVNILLMLIWIG